MQLIIFENADKTVGVIHPIIFDCGIDALAKKDVPSGLPYWVVDESVLPQTREYRDAWRIDHDAMGAPHGYGHEASTFEGVLDDNA